MSKYIIVNGTFREISDEELMHFKYIKREKVNGKWVYYYDKKQADADLKRYEDKATEARENRTHQLGRSINSKLDLERAEAARDKVYARGITNVGDVAARAVADRQVGLAKGATYLTAYDVRHADKVAKKYEKKYQKMKLKQVAHSTISKGIVKVANFFSKLFG